jgi:hypothetical protein
MMHVGYKLCMPILSLVERGGYFNFGVIEEFGMTDCS